MTAFVLVPGACHGGWWYDPLAAALEADGHSAIAVTLAGLEDKPQLDRLITLDTHIDQVAAARSCQVLCKFLPGRRVRWSSGRALHGGGGSSSQASAIVSAGSG